MKKRIVILGCTGSIGKSALKIIKSQNERFELVGLSAHSNQSELLRIAHEFNCMNYCLTSLDTDSLKKLIQSANADIVLNGISGTAGLLPSIEAIKAGSNLALANKETIVTAGNLIMNEAKKRNVRILPVDSEHSAIFNLIERFGENNIKSVVITASGGPFKHVPKNLLAKMTAQDALKHPTWNMGKKITIDSATLANKGLEVIEANKLFCLPPKKIQVVVHPQSLVHSLIRTNDGVLYAQISKPDMAHPILNALTYPEYVANNLEELDLWTENEMTFFKPRFEDFPMLDFAYKSLEKGGSYTIAYNAANEAAVNAFLKGAVLFTDIAKITESVLQHDWSFECVTFDDVFDFDNRARSIANTYIRK